VIKGLGGGLSHPGNYATTAITVLFRGEWGVGCRLAADQLLNYFSMMKYKKIFKTFM